MTASRSSARFGLSGFALKLIAFATMLLDHIGAAILESSVLRTAIWDGEIDAFFNSPTLALVRKYDVVLRLIGRISFPIFCFLLVEGFLHTHSVKKYALRLGVFALISEIPFDLAFSEYWWDTEYQNVFFTLLLGLAAMAFLRRFGDRSLLGLLLALGCAVLAELFQTDYGAFGVVLILILYLFRNRPGLQTLIGGASLLWEITAPLAFLPIRLYNGERGWLGGRYLFYILYPAHILLLCFVRFLLFGG